MTRCSSCGTLYDEVRWVPVLPMGTVRPFRRSCPACTTGRLPRWGVASDLITRAALRTCAVAMAASALWLWLVSATGASLHFVWPLLGILTAVFANHTAEGLPTFLRRRIACAAVCFSLCVTHGALAVFWADDLYAPLPWILVSVLFSSLTLSLLNREPGGGERVLARRRRQVA